MASRRVLRGLGVADVLVLLVGVLAAFVVGGDEVPAAGARVTVDGSASVVRLDGTTDALASGDIVRAGEEVQAVDGTFGLALAGGGTLEGRAGFGRASDTRVVVGARPELLAGELLLLGDEGLDVDAAGTTIALTAVDGAARVDRGLALRAAAYRGGLALDSAGQERSVGALRQLGIASLGRPPGSAEPFLVDEADPWDRRFLGAAIDLSRQLDGYAGAFSADAAPGAERDAALFETALPALADEPAFAAALRSSGIDAAGEVLVGAAIVSLGERGDFADRWNDVFDFRADGAGWGLVAFDQGLDDAVVLSTVEGALGRVRPTPEVAIGTPPTVPGGGDDDVDAPGPGGTTPTTAPPSTGGGPPTSTPSDDPDGPAPATPDLPTVPGLPPTTVPTPPPVTDPTDVVPDTGSGTVDETVDTAGETVTSVVEDVVGGIGDLLGDDGDGDDGPIGGLLP